MLSTWSSIDFQQASRRFCFLTSHPRSVSSRFHPIFFSSLYPYGFFKLCVLFFPSRGTERVALFHSYFHGPAFVHRCITRRVLPNRFWMVSSERAEHHVPLSPSHVSLTLLAKIHVGRGCIYMDTTLLRAHVTTIRSFFFVFFFCFVFRAKQFFSILQSNVTTITLLLLWPGIPGWDNKNSWREEGLV